MELKAALDALLDGRKQIYAALDANGLPPRARQMLLASLEATDEAIRRIHASRHWTAQIENILMAAAQRGTYSKGDRVQ